MKNPWLAFLSIAVITIIVFIFFVLRLIPIQPPKLASPIQPGTVAEPTVTFVNPTRGNPSPKVTIIEFSDFECDACKELATAIEIALRTYPDDVRHVWKDMPNESAHPLATPAAIAAHCADRQGKFWEYHDELFNRQAFLSEEEFSQIAHDLALDMTSFEACYSTQDTLPLVKKDFEEGLGLGIVATPTIFVNQTPYVGALRTDELLAAIEKELTAP